MNINYINESVISVAVMRKHTHTHSHTHSGPSGRGQCVKDVCCLSTKRFFSESIAENLADD